MNDKVLSIEKDIFYKIRISKQQKCAAIGAIIAGIMAHLYGMVNMLFNDDSISAFYGAMASEPYDLGLLFANAINGKWFTGVANVITSWFRPPYMCGIIILLYAVVMAILLVKLLDINSVAGSVLIGALVASFPAVLGFINLWDTGQMLSVLLCVISVYLVEFRNRVVLPAIILGMGLGIVPVNISVVIVLYIYLMIRRLMSYEMISQKTFLGFPVKCVFMAVLGIFFLYLSILIIPKIMGYSDTSFTSYQGGADAITGKWLSNLGENLLSAFSKTRKLRIASMQLVPQLKVTLRICYAMQVVSVSFLFISRKIYRNPIKSLFAFLCIGFLPFGISAISIVSPEFNYSLHHQMVWAILIGATWMLVEEAIVQANYLEFRNKEYICRVLFVLLCANFALLDYGFILTDNIVYRAQHYVTEKDTALMIRVLSGLDSIDEFDYETNPVYIMNLQDVAYDYNTRSPLANEAELYRTITTDIDTNLWCYGGRSAKAHMSLYEGIDIKDPDDDVSERIMNQKIDIWNEHMDMQYGDYDIFRFEDTDTYVVVIKTAISWGLVNNR